MKLEPWKSLIRSKPPRPPPPARRQIPSRSLGIDFADHVMIFRADGVDDIIVQHVSEDVVASSESIQGALASYWPDGIRLTSLPAVGSYVAAEYPGGSGFYRSRVLSVNCRSFCDEFHEQLKQFCHFQMAPKNRNWNWTTWTTD